MSKRMLVLMCSIFLIVPLLFMGCGSDGSNGSNGLPGAPGAPGATGATGATGPAGSGAQSTKRAFCATARAKSLTSPRCTTSTRRPVMW